MFDNYVPSTVFLLYFGVLVAVHGDMGTHIGITTFMPLNSIVNLETLGVIRISSSIHLYIL
jgi:hypothetical protein